MKIIRPEKFKEISISRKRMGQEMKEILENYRGSVWLKFVSHLIVMSIIRPEKFKEIEVLEKN